MGCKLVSLPEMVGRVDTGTVLSFGGGGTVRKPMAATCALADAGKEVELTVFLAGPETDLLIGMGTVRSLQFAYVGLDGLGLAPNFRKGRESGQLSVIEASEQMYIAGVEATLRGVPFMPTRSGRGVQLMEVPGTPYKRFDCPLTGEELTAVPPIRPDVLFLHVNEADRHGNLRISGDCFLDPQLARAAKEVYATAERVVDRLGPDIGARETTISRLWVSGVCELPGGAGFTSLFPDYMLDLDQATEYASNAADPTWLAEFLAGGGGR